MFKKLVNFRDLGGLKTRSGETVKKHRLLRSGVLQDLPMNEHEILVDAYDLKTVVDLRRDDELVKHPDDQIDGVKNYHISIMEGDTKTTTQETLMQSIDEHDVHGLMKGLYRQLIMNPYAQKQYRAFVEVLLNQKSGAVLFHCQAGKDRTGLAAAIILTILGVSESDIMEDYLKTNASRKQANEEMAKGLRAKGKTEQEIEHFLALMSVSADFLEAAYDEATKNYGSFNAYITKALHVSDKERQKLKDMYLIG